MSSMQLEGKTTSLKKRLFDFFSNSGRCRVVALAATDALCLLIIGSSLVLIYYLLGFAQYKLSIYWRLWPIFPLFVFLNAVCRLYHGNWMYPAMPLPPVEEFRRLFASSVFSHLLLMSFLGFTRHNLEYSRLIIGLSGILTGLFSQSFRNLTRLLIFKAGIFQIPVILVGDGLVAKRIESNLRCNPYIGLSIKAKLGEHELHDILPIAKKIDVKILLACQNERLFRAQLQDFATWFNYIEYLPRVEIFPVFGAHAVAIGQVGGLEMVNQLRMKALRWEKDLLDAIASVILFILALPIMILISFLVKLTSKGRFCIKLRDSEKMAKKSKSINSGRCMPMPSRGWK